jgi:hypothetical protein
MLRVSVRVRERRPDRGYDRTGSYWTGPGRGWLAELDLPPVSREIITDSLASLDALAVTIDRLDGEVRAHAKASFGCHHSRRLLPLRYARPRAAPVGAACKWNARAQYFSCIFCTPPRARTGGRRRTRSLLAGACGSETDSVTNKCGFSTSGWAECRCRRCHGRTVSVLSDAVGSTRSGPG